MLVLEIATPPSTMATMAVLIENRNMQVTEFMRPVALDLVPVGPEPISTSNRCISALAG